MTFGARGFGGFRFCFGWFYGLPAGPESGAREPSSLSNPAVGAMPSWRASVHAFRPKHETWDVLLILTVLSRDYKGWY